jgi:hypothetical protein
MVVVAKLRRCNSSAASFKSASGQLRNSQLSLSGLSAFPAQNGSNGYLTISHQSIERGPMTRRLYRIPSRAIHTLDQQPEH